MKKNNITYDTNIQPHLMAALFSEQKKYAKTSIQFDEKNNVSQINEVTKTTVNKNNEFIIFKKSETEERQILKNKLGERSDYFILLKNAEFAMEEFKIEVLLKERQHTLSTSELELYVHDLPNFLTTDQQKAIAYFLPYSDLIKSDLKLMERCFFTIINYPIKIKKTVSKKIKLNSLPVGRWITDHSGTVGGIFQKKKSCYQIEIGPVPMNDLQRFIPKHQFRRFLEEALFPLFLPKKWDWETVVEVPKENKKFIANTNNESVIIGFNSRVASYDL